MRQVSRWWISLFLLLASPCLRVSVVQSSHAAAEVTYWQDVRPVLRKSCTVCHNPRMLKEPDISGGLTLDSYAAVLRWAAKKKDLVTPGKSADSLLYQVVVTTDTDKRMPLGASALPAEAVAVLKKWIDGGAKEGTRPIDVSDGPSSRRGRSVDVMLATETRGLSLALKVGPLPPVVAVAFDPKGKLLATGAYGRVVLWDIATGRPTRVLRSVLGAVHDVRFSHDGTLLAVAGGQPSAKGDLRLFTVADGKLKAVLAGHEDVVASVAWRPDGRQLASGSYDRTVRIWDLTSGKSLRTLTMHSDFVTSVTYSPDGKLLASGSKDRSVRVTEAATGAGKYTLSDRDDDVLAVAFHPDGKSVVAAGHEPRLSWWNMADGTRARAVTGHRGAVHELAFDARGKLLASAGADGTVRLWDGASGAVARTLTAGSLAYAVAVSPDGGLVAAGCFDGLVRLYDAKGQHRATLLARPGQGDGADWLTLAPAGYAAGSKPLLELARWTRNGQAVPAAAHHCEELVLRSLKGETLPPPTPTK